MMPMAALLEPGMDAMRQAVLFSAESVPDVGTARRRALAAAGDEGVACTAAPRAEASACSVDRDREGRWKGWSDIHGRRVGNQLGAFHGFLCAKGAGDAIQNTGIDWCSHGGCEYQGGENDPFAH